MRQFDGHTARQSHITFAVQQGLRGIMHRHKAGRTGRLHIDRRAFQIKDMADPRGQKILVVPGMAQQEHAGVFHQIAVRTQVEIEIRSHAAAGINANRPLEAFGRVARSLHRLPSHLHELAVLRVEDRGLLG